MSSERKGPSKRTFLARVQTALYTNKNLAFVISVVLAALIYFASTNDASSPYVAKRHGLGAGDNAGELRSALRRKGDGRAAVAIIRVVGMNADKNDPNANPNDDVKYLVQVKSHDYPIVPFRGSACLLGGNANKKDATPLDTLKRELNEELHHPAWVDQIDPTTVVDYSHKQHTDGPSNNSSAVPPSGTVHYLGATLHFQSSELISQPNPYAFVCALYEITLRPEDLPPSAIYPRGANIQEGRVVLLTEDQLIRHSKYAWGYEYTMEAYFGKTTVNKQKGTAVSNVDDNTWRETVWTPSK